MKSRRDFIQKTSIITATTLLGAFTKVPAFPVSGGKTKQKILLRSSWQTINIGDIAHTPGVLALCEKYLPDVEVILWAGSVNNGVREMLLKRFPNLQIILSHEKELLKKAFEECSFLLHGSGPYLVASKHVDQWIKETGKPFGVYGITLPEKFATEEVIALLNQASFVFFRDSVSLEFARAKGVNAPIMEFGPDGAFAVDLRNNEAAEKFIQKNGLEKGEFFCVIPRYRKTPEWKIPSKKKPVDKDWDKYNESMVEHDLKPYREAIISVVRNTAMKILICPEDMTQMELGKIALYDPLPEDVKKRVVWREKFWLTDEALSTYCFSAGLFGLEMHSPIMCIGNGIPACVGRFPTQTTKGWMWKDIGLSEWFFDSDSTFDMEDLTLTILEIAQHPELAKTNTLRAKQFVEKRQQQTMKVLRETLKLLN